MATATLTAGSRVRTTAEPWMNAYRGQKLKTVPANANVSKNGVAYFPFESEKEVGEWMDRAVGEWWDDETI